VERRTTTPTAEDLAHLGPTSSAPVEEGGGEELQGEDAHPDPTSSGPAEEGVGEGL